MLFTTKDKRVYTDAIVIKINLLQFCKHDHHSYFTLQFMKADIHVHVYAIK